MTQINAKQINPKRGEIWLVDLEPTRGSELQKIRPMVVLSADTIRLLTLRVAVPLTGWQPHFTATPWKICIEPNAQNKLAKTSAADSLQIRCLSLDRFSKRLGLLPKSTIADIIYAINYCLEE